MYATWHENLIRWQRFAAGKPYSFLFVCYYFDIQSKINRKGKNLDAFDWMFMDITVTFLVLLYLFP